MATTERECGHAGCSAELRDKYRALEIEKNTKIVMLQAENDQLKETSTARDSLLSGMENSFRTSSQELLTINLNLHSLLEEVKRDRYHAPAETKKLLASYFHKIKFIRDMAGRALNNAQAASLPGNPYPPLIPRTDSLELPGDE